MILKVISGFDEGRKKEGFYFDEEALSGMLSLYKTIISPLNKKQPKSYFHVLEFDFMNSSNVGLNTFRYELDVLN